MRPQVVETADAALPDGPLGVTFENVSFVYRDDPERDDGDPVLHDISFQLAPGQMLGILGRTGSGKSTLSRLLFRLYDSDAGTIRLGRRRTCAMWRWPICGSAWGW